MELGILTKREKNCHQKWRRVLFVWKGPEKLWQLKLNDEKCQPKKKKRERHLHFLR